MNAQDLKNSILQLAIQGKLVEQREEEGTAKELLEKIEVEKKRLIKEGKIKKEKKQLKISEDEVLFDIPESWEWTRMS
ncbi:TPA: restriction endonuclease, partial [Enterococcus faecium]